MKKLLIISPYFPPTNAADMQRIRTSLPYFKEFGWEPEVVTVDEKYSDMVKDELLVQSLPTGIKIHKVKALSKNLTSKLGLGSIALRSLFYYRQTVNGILEQEKFDLIYFSTTQFPVCILGAYWKKRFGVPYVIDMQDPWHSDYYQDKPKDQRPAKYWFSYRLNKYLEPKAVKHADGLIGVSESYSINLKTRYPQIKNIPSATITFGAFEPDLAIAKNNQHKFKPLLQPGYNNIVYVGRGGADMHKALGIVFEALKNGLSQQPDTFKNLRFYFIGTSYAPAGKGVPTILPLAKAYGVEDYVIEITDRISYYHSLVTLQQADVLFIPGSADAQYTASKIFPYLLTQKPLLAIFNKNSNAVEILNSCAENADIFTFDDETAPSPGAIGHLLSSWASDSFNAVKLLPLFNQYSAKNLTQKQTELFTQAIKYFETTHTNA